MQEENSKNEKKISLPAAVVLSAVIIGGALFVGGKSTEYPVAQDNLTVVSEVRQDDFVRGEIDAPITIIEYADFSCPYCGVHHETLKALVEESEGRVKWVYRHLPIFNMDAATASQCVGEIAGNEKFWEFSDTLYQNQRNLNNDLYRQTAINLGVTESEYDACISGQIVRSKIDAEFDRVRILLGFRATPHNVIVDSQGRTFSFSGAIPKEDLRSIIEGLL